MPRGVLTPEIQEKAVAFFGREITQRELRLIPYLLHCLMNDSNVERSRVNAEEKQILSDWEKQGYIQHFPFKISKRFYDFANELMFISYIQGCERNLTEPPTA